MMARRQKRPEASRGPREGSMSREEAEKAQMEASTMSTAARTRAA